MKTIEQLKADASEACRSGFDQCDDDWRADEAYAFACSALSLIQDLLEVLESQQQRIEQLEARGGDHGPNS